MIYYHSAGHARRVRCKECGDEMDAVYCPSIRDTCTPCGGVSLVKPKEKPDAEEMKERRRAAARERKRARAQQSQGSVARAGTLLNDDGEEDAYWSRKGRYMGPKRRRNDDDDEPPRAA
jgi:hypothetical protein